MASIKETIDPMQTVNTGTAAEAVDKQDTDEAEILEKAKEEAAAILAAAEAEAAKITEAAKAAKAEKKAKPAKPEPEKLVPVKLFKDNDKYKDDVFVAVNGRSFQIRRGETVMVPDYVAAVLEQSMAQDNATANLIERESGAYAAEAKARNI